MILEPRSQTIKLGDSIILECLVNGKPKPKIQWLHNSLLISNEYSQHKFIGIEGTSLLIENAQLSDAGIYTCRAENKHDSVDSLATIVIKGNFFFF